MTDYRDHYDVAVIGAGPAGTAAALRAAELGASVVVLEAARVGGTCVNTGCVPTRVLAKTARLIRETRHADVYGVEVAAPTIDWTTTVARVRERVDRVRSIKREAERFAEAGVDLIQEGRARFADDSTLVLASGRRLTASSILVCVGGHSRRLPIPGAELATVPEHVLDLPSLPRRVAVIGAGNTGAQLVTVFSSFGSEVTVLDLAPRVLMPSDPSVSEAEVVRSAIPADAYFRTVVPHIFAVGDANGRDMLVQAAQFEGEAAAENAVLGANRRTPHHLLPAGGFTDPDYAGVGLTEPQARERDITCVVATVQFSAVDRAVIDDRETGFLKLISDPRRELILGAHAVGENAIEVIQSVTTAMAAGVDVSTLANVRFAYPTYSAVIGMAARALLREAPVS